MNDLSRTQQQISDICDSVKKLLISKNKKYGDSALAPVRVFSKASAVEQIFVRIDDKLSRISKGVGLLGNDEDVIDDLIGYLILLKIAMQRGDEEQWDGCNIGDSAIPCLFREAKQEPGKPLNDSEWLELHTSGDRFT
jgi:hypothetical protein